MPTQPAIDFRIQHLREKLGGLYEFQALLGRGAFAAVYLVCNQRLDRLEALKVLSAAYDDEDVAFVRRFIQEAKLVASLDHPNIVKVYDFGEIDGIVWFSMQYVDGPTLRAELTAQGRLSPIAVARLAIPLLGALGYSHQLGTIHRDIKPSNILLDRRGHPYIMDFGIAKSSGSVLKTMTGTILGTPAYISPEQIQEEVVDGRADLYSLAVAMYEMLAGQTPFRAEDPLRTIVMRVNEDPDPPSKHCSTLDETLETIVMKGLARQPEDRYPDADAMRRALVEYLSERSDQQEMILMASASEPRALERLPSIVPGNAALEVAQGAPSVKNRRRGSDGDSSTPVRKRARAWAAALVAVLVLAIGVSLVLRKLRHDTLSSPVGSVPATAAESDEPPAREGQAMGHDAQEAPLETDPPDPPAERDESPPTATESAEKGAPGSEPSTGESAVAPQPAEAQTARAAARSPRAPPPVPTRRPLTAPRILSAVEPMLPPGRTAECIGQSVIISLKVGEDGRVLRSRILKSGPEGCSEAARVAAEAYVFEPARDTEGEPVTASTTLNIRFTEVEE